MPYIYKLLIALVILCCNLSSIDATQFRFASIYQDHMVLQRASASYMHRAKLCGFADDNAFISMNLFGKMYTTIATKTSTGESVWKIVLDPILFSDGPVNIEVTQTATDGAVSKISLSDVLFGDVYVCSGQSNMDWPVIADINGQVEQNAGVNFKKIRIFATQIKGSPIALNDFQSDGIKFKWSEPTPNVLPLFSAVCWYFGKNLFQRLNVPIGLVQSSVGGTNIEKWMTSEIVDRCSAQKQADDSIYFNAMIKPLMSMSIFGVIWYQGESNAGYNLDKYSCLFTNMVQEWRSKWFIDTDASTNIYFPFGFVQIANFASENNNNIDFFRISDYPWLRWHQTADFGYLPNLQQQQMFMASAIDLVEGPDVQDQIHPRFKEDVGKRLAAGALNIGYNLPVEWKAPRVLQAIYTDPRIIIEFGDVTTLEKMKSSQIVLNSDSGFEVCCDNARCYQDQYSNSWQPLFGIELNGLLYDSSAIFLKPQNCVVPRYVRYLWRQKPCTYKNCPLYLIDPKLPITPFIYEIKRV